MKKSKYKYENDMLLFLELLRITNKISQYSNDKKLYKSLKYLYKLKSYIKFIKYSDDVHHTSNTYLFNMARFITAAFYNIEYIENQKYVKYMTYIITKEKDKYRFTMSIDYISPIKISMLVNKSYDEPIIIEYTCIYKDATIEDKYIIYSDKDQTIKYTNTRISEDKVETKTIEFHEKVSDFTAEDVLCEISIFVLNNLYKNYKILILKRFFSHE